MTGNKISLKMVLPARQRAALLQPWCATPPMPWHSTELLFTIDTQDSWTTNLKSCNHSYHMILITIAGRVGSRYLSVVVLIPKLPKKSWPYQDNSAKVRKKIKKMKPSHGVVSACAQVLQKVTIIECPPISHLIYSDCRITFCRYWLRFNRPCRIWISWTISSVNPLLENSSR